MSGSAALNRPHPRWPPPTQADDDAPNTQGSRRGGNDGVRLLSRLRKKLSFPDRESLKKAHKLEHQSELVTLPPAPMHGWTSQEEADGTPRHVEIHSRGSPVTTGGHPDDDHVPATDPGVFGRLLHRAKHMTGRKHARRPENEDEDEHSEGRHLPDQPLADINIAAGEPTGQAEQVGNESMSKTQNASEPEAETTPVEIPKQKAHATRPRGLSLRERLRPKSRGNGVTVADTNPEGKARFDDVPRLPRPASDMFTTPVPSPHTRYRLSYISSADLRPSTPPAPSLGEQSPNVFPAPAGVDVMGLVKEKRLSSATVGGAAYAWTGPSRAVETLEAFAEDAPAPRSEPMTPGAPSDLAWKEVPPSSLHSRPRTSSVKRHSFRLAPDPWDTSQTAIQAPISSFAASQISLVSITRTLDKKPEPQAPAPQLPLLPTSRFSDIPSANTSNALHIVTSSGEASPSSQTSSPRRFRPPTDYEIFLARAEAREREDQEMREMAWRSLAARAAAAGMMPPGYVKPRPHTQYGTITLPALDKRSSGWFEVHNYRNSWAPAHSVTAVTAGADFWTSAPMATQKVDEKFSDLDESEKTTPPRTHKEQTSKMKRLSHYIRPKTAGNDKPTYRPTSSYGEKRSWGKAQRMSTLVG